MFKNEFKYYKSRRPNPDFENVVDFNQRRWTSADRHKVASLQPYSIDTKNDCSCHNALGLINSSSWKIYEISDKPGLMYIVNPFTNKGQQYWVERCLQEFTKKPNRLNLDPFKELQPSEDWWQATQTLKGGVRAYYSAVFNSDDERAHKLLQKLRWATLGYHHNWDTKEYSETARDEFPSDLAQLSKLVVDTLYGPAASSYQAEAAIVNFYHLDSTLSGHKDVSEPNMDSPLLSVSFGQSAVFLVGGETTDDPVTPMLLHSGDIVVMSGQARKCYHGVPRIVLAPTKPWTGDDWENNPCGRYLDSSRINMNIRQVLLPGQTSVKYQK